MFTTNSKYWHIGIDLSTHQIRLAALCIHQHKPHLLVCWQQEIHYEESIDPNKQDCSTLKKALKTWRQKLPKSCEINFAIPIARTFYQQFPWPDSALKNEKLCQTYIRAKTEKTFPLSLNEIVFDYRIINKQLYLRGARKQDITFWQNFFRQCGYTLHSIDISSCALRYLANVTNVPHSSCLVYQRKHDMFWMGSQDMPILGHQNNVENTKIPSQLHTFLESEKHTHSSVYFIGKSAILEKQHYIRWEWQQHIHPAVPFPENFSEFVIAIGLALRGKDQ